jgi:acetolactate synthase-1/3 small subunit
MTNFEPEAEGTMGNGTPSCTVLRLLVRNHPGVMSHVCGMFARRAFNVDGILCLPVGDRRRSAMLLAVHDDARVDQLMRQLRKLEDVIEVERTPAASAAFEAVGMWLR